MLRMYPEEYFNQQNSFKEGIKIGAVLILIGIVVGALIVIGARK